jgi:hypothetical protein
MDQFTPKPAPEPVALDSSRIASMAYDPDSGELELEFVKGGSYLYSGVPQNVADGLQSSSSPGRYFDKFIKSYPTRRI